MRVFLDTNVLVSGFATRGLSADVVRMVMADHELLTGEVVISEMSRILREEFNVSEQDVRDIAQLLRRFHVEPRPERMLQIEVRDPDDAWVLASALAAGAEALVTGDKDLLEIADRVRQIVITSPRGFWEMVRETQGEPLS